MPVAQSCSGSSFWLAIAGDLNDCLLWSLGVLGVLSVKGKREQQTQCGHVFGEAFVPCALQLICWSAQLIIFAVYSDQCFKVQFSFCCKLGIRDVP